jgi:SAM-dependent methyltransferase
MLSERVSVAPTILHEDSYYASAVRMLPSGRILEIGCANGRIGQVIQARRRDISLVGADIDAEMLDGAPSGVYEQLVEWDLNAGCPPVDGPFDGLLALDVLEHLVEPRTVLRGLTSLLRNGASVIVGVPNWLHYTNRLRILCGRWRYDPNGGLYDSTHLRFFSHRNLDQLVPGELQITQVVDFGWMPGGGRLIGKPAALRTYQVMYQGVQQPLVRRFPRLLAKSFVLELRAS